jgi:hypothetical protein
MAQHTPVSSVHDIQPQLSTLRSYWLGWKDPSRVDDGIEVYRTGLQHALLNGVLRLRGRTVDDGGHP